MAFFATDSKKKIKQKMCSLERKVQNCWFSPKSWVIAQSNDQKWYCAYACLLGWLWLSSLVTHCYAGELGDVFLCGVTSNIFLYSIDFFFERIPHAWEWSWTTCSCQMTGIYFSAKNSPTYIFCIKSYDGSWIGLYASIFN